jgi:hypothetical protein
VPDIIEIEDIEQMRQEQGIDDVELRTAIRRLKVGDCVRLTFTGNAGRAETVPVRITCIRPDLTFRGKLVQRALRMPLGTMVEFTWDHVHSVVESR